MTREHKLGFIVNEYEIDRLVKIVDMREEIKDFKKHIAPMLKVLIDSGIRISDISTGWCTCVYLDKDQLLPEKVYGQLASMCGSSPEITIDEKTGTYGFYVDSRHLWGVDVVISGLKCRIKKTVITEMKEFETVKYEVDGDCSGLEV